MDLAVIGYLLHDVLEIEGKTKECLGGVAAYTSLAAAKLGLETGIVSKVGKDFKYWGELNGIALEGVLKQEKTTVFHNDYKKGERWQRVENIGERIMPEDIPVDCLKARAIHLGPVFNEIDPETIAFVRQNSRAFITLDPQGFLRGEENSIVFPKEMDYGTLDLVDMVKASEKDCSREGIEAMKEKCGIVILTRGKRGSTVFFEGKQCEIPFFRAERVVDETGAGDVFVAGFIKKYLDSKNIEASAVFASAAASFAVEDFGVKGIGSEREIAQRIKSQLA